MKAKFDGWCGICGDQFWEDEEITFSGSVGRWVHEACKDEN